MREALTPQTFWSDLQSNETANSELVYILFSSSFQVESYIINRHKTMDIRFKIFSNVNIFTLFFFFCSLILPADSDGISTKYLPVFHEWLVQRKTGLKNSPGCVLQGTVLRALTRTWSISIRTNVSHSPTRLPKRWEHGWRRERGQFWMAPHSAPG